jgi:hypothetical protein
MGDWRKLHNEELYDCYCPPDIINVIRPLRMTWAARVARTGGVKMHRSLRWVNLTERDHVEDLGVDGRIILQ